jgi:hypothetical protein
MLDLFWLWSLVEAPKPVIRSVTCSTLAPAAFGRRSGRGGLGATFGLEERWKGRSSWKVQGSTATAWKRKGPIRSSWKVQGSVRPGKKARGSALRSAKQVGFGKDQNNGGIGTVVVGLATISENAFFERLALSLGSKLVLKWVLSLGW